MEGRAILQAPGPLASRTHTTRTYVAATPSPPELAAAFEVSSLDRAKVNDMLPATALSGRRAAGISQLLRLVSCAQNA